MKESKEVLVNVYKEDESIMRQKSRVQWLNLGDKNTAFFGSATRERYQCNSLYKILGMDRKPLSTAEKMEVCCAHFSKCTLESPLMRKSILKVFKEC